MFLNYLQTIMPEDSFTEFKVPLGEWPDRERFSGFVLTGSAKSCYEPLPWILELLKFIRQLHQDKDTQKTLGICFGHQMIALALDGEVKQHDRGWGVGVRDFDLIASAPWMEGEQKRLSLLFSHQDQVTKLPQGAIHLATDAFCTYQMYRIGQHIFCMQGHPEFTKEFSRSRMEASLEIIGADTFEKGMTSLEKSTDHLLIGRWINSFFKG